MSNWRIGFALFLVALALIGCSPEPVSKVAPQSSGGERVPSEVVVEASKVAGMESISETVVVGKEAPDFKIKDVDGKEWKLSDYRGKTVLLDFWAFW